MIEYAKETLVRQITVLEGINNLLMDEIKASGIDPVDDHRVLQIMRRNSKTLTEILRFALELERKEKAPAEAEAQ